jgi:hypothetical protein
VHINYGKNEVGLMIRLMKNLTYWTKLVSINVGLITLTLSPVAQGADAVRKNKEHIQEFMKVTGLNDTKNMTVGEFYYRMQAWIPEEIKGEMSAWATLHKDDMMPSVNVQVVKDQLGQEQYRLLMQREGQSLALETTDSAIKIGSTKFTGKDYHNLKAFQAKLLNNEPYLKKLMQQEPRGAIYSKLRTLKLDEFSRLTHEQRAVYFFHIRRAIEEAQKVLGDLPEDVKTSFLFRNDKSIFITWLLGQMANAQNDDPELILPPPKVGGNGGPKPPVQAKKPRSAQRAPAKKSGTVRASNNQIPQVNDSCIVAGYKSTYGENKSCGGLQSGRKDFLNQIRASFSQTFKNAPQCSGSSYPCNPIVYGFSKSGSPHCINQDEIRNATSICNGRAPLNGKDDKKGRQDIVQSWVKASGNDTILKFDKDGRVDKSQYGLIEAQLKSLQDYIGDAVKFCDSPEGKRLGDKRSEQKNACEAIRVRAFAIDQFSVDPIAAASVNCADIPGSTELNGKCVCQPPMREYTTSEGKSCGTPPVAVREPPDDTSPARVKPKPKDDEECTGFFCGTNWVLPAGLLVGGGLLAWWLWPKDKKKVVTPTYVPPVCSGSACTEPPPPVVCPGHASCPPPPPPPPITNEGGTGESPVIVAPPGRR